MAKEIERTFLVTNDSFKNTAINMVHIRQGYLNRDPERTVRVRLADEKAYLTVKGKNKGNVREEFEYEIPYADGTDILRLCSGRVLDKTRYLVPYKGHIWEVDEYHGDLEGLIVTEVELKDADEHVDIPDFAGKEVSGDPKYYNSQL